jgi:TRAP transporter TAXI family solute receptor
MSLYPEPFHLIVRKDAGIKHFRDLKGKRVAAGSPGTSTRETAHVMMGYFGIDSKQDVIDAPLTFRETPAALCDNKIDAILFASGVPTPLVQEATNTCDAKLAPIDGPEINKLLSERQYFAPLTIPGGSYPGNDANVNTFGSSATIVSSQSVDADTVYHVVKALFDNFEVFKQQKPFYTLMTREASASVARVGVPYHDGAQRFYQEHGLLK